MDHSLSTFLCGCAPFHDLIFFAKSLDEFEDANQANSTFLFIDGARTARFKDTVGWTALAMATTKVGEHRLVCAIGPNGELWEGLPHDASSIAGAIGFGEHSWRAMALINGQFIACGMDRQVAMRVGPLTWRDISAPPAPDDKRIVGFESIDGFSPNELYAVGWQGEIWLRKDGNWRQIDSPASGNLTAVCCSEDGTVYAVGQAGLMLKGRDDLWVEVDSGLSENLQDVRDFDGQIYAVTDFDIYELTGNGLQPVALPDGEGAGTCLHLLKGVDGLVSLGLKDVFKLHVGRWNRVV